MRHQRRLAVEYFRSLPLLSIRRGLFIRNWWSQYDHICLYLLILVLLPVLILFYLLNKIMALLNLMSVGLPQTMLLPQHFRMQELFLLLLDYIQPALLRQHLKRLHLDSPTSLSNTSLPTIFFRFMLLVDRFDAWFLQWSLDCLIGRLYIWIDWVQL